MHALTDNPKTACLRAAETKMKTKHVNCISTYVLISFSHGYSATLATKLIIKLDLTWLTWQQYCFTICLQVAEILTSLKRSFYIIMFFVFLLHQISSCSSFCIHKIPTASFFFLPVFLPIEIVYYTVSVMWKKNFMVILCLFAEISGRVLE